ncbi:hypothetical pox protein [Squirrelpox virus]|uniref:C11R n=1 Tax=Squirrelpox virus TaxID=240426 RepID=Q1HTQ2_9POXV|nr:hypothetical pox protein [Squirrelpox virus]ABD51484.1 C11R [Squirrelpox virus]CCD83316.1 hypothetical pox protein [Squirrelpox virus]
MGSVANYLYRYVRLPTDIVDEDDDGLPVVPGEEDEPLVRAAAFAAIEEQRRMDAPVAQLIDLDVKTEI